MKLTRKQHEVINLGAGETTSFSIDTSEIGLIFSILSEGFYKDPEGSVVRELASNSWDANLEAGNKDKAIIIRINAGDGNPYISFIDQGIGISPDRAMHIYSKLFASTKRDNDDEIGGFGLGSKTPFAVADSFQCITTHDGIRYHYFIPKDEQGLPQLELMGQEPVDTPSGTEIRVTIPSGSVKTWVDAVEKQCSYFHNLVVDYPAEFHTREQLFNSRRRINFKTFSILSGEPVFTSPHVILGQVRYDLDWDAVFPGKKEPSIPIGIHFNIGELRPVPNRESFIMDPRTKSLLDQKITAAMEEIYEWCESKLKITETFEDWWIIRNHGKFVDIEGRHYRVSSVYEFLNKSTDNKILWPPMIQLEQNFPKLAQELRHPDDLLSAFKVTHEIHRTTTSEMKRNYYNNASRVLAGGSSFGNRARLLLFLDRGESYSPKKNRYIYHARSDLFNAKYNTRSGVGIPNLIRINTERLAELRDHYSIMGVKMLEKILYQVADEIAVAYKDVEIDPSWYDPSAKLKVKRVWKDEQVIVRLYRPSQQGGMTYDDPNIKLKELADKHATVIWSVKKDDKFMRAISGLAYAKEYAYNAYDWTRCQAYIFAAISEVDIPMMNDLDNAINIHDVLKPSSAHRSIVRAGTAVKIDRWISANDFLVKQAEFFEHIDKRISSRIQALVKYRDSYLPKALHQNRDFWSAMIDHLEDHKLVDHTMQEHMNTVQDFYDKTTCDPRLGNIWKRLSKGYYGVIDPDAANVARYLLMKAKLYRPQFHPPFHSYKG